MNAERDWRRADARNDAETHGAALAEPGTQPLTLEGLASMQQTPPLTIVRRALGLTRDEFARRFRFRSVLRGIGSKGRRRLTRRYGLSAGAWRGTHWPFSVRLPRYRRSGDPVLF